MSITKIKTQITLVYSDGGEDITLDLKTIPAEGVAAILRWLPTQSKPDPAEPHLVINAYADSAYTDEPGILKNLFTAIIFGRLVEMASAVPSQSTLDAQAALRKAAEHLEDAKKREVGLIPPD